MKKLLDKMIEIVFLFHVHFTRSCSEWNLRQQIKNFVSFILLILIEIILITKNSHSTDIIFAALLFPLVIYMFKSNTVSSKYSYLGYLEKCKNYGVLHKNTIDHLIDLM